MVINDDIKNIPIREYQVISNHSIEKQEAPKVENVKEGGNPARTTKDAPNIQKAADIGIHLEVDNALHIVVAKIVDKESGEVIRQIPSEEVIKISKAVKAEIDKNQSAHLIDTEA
jgi:uncharacterized FlaG/YvyC family protein